ncbi:apoptosis facilitator Bcl-2-like protein 14 [Pholidichthys leucotaenia]
MANGHVKIHDPFSGQNGRTTHKNCDSRPTSDSESMNDTVEFRIMMAYATRKNSSKDKTDNSQTLDNMLTENGNKDADIPTPPQTPVKTETELTERKKKKKKNGWKRFAGMFSCTRPQREEEELPKTVDSPTNVGSRCAASIGDDEVNKEDKVEEVTNRLLELANGLNFIPSEWEADTGKDDPEVMKVIGLLLRESGDKLDDEVLKEANIAAELFWNYSFFKTLISALLLKMGLRHPDPNAPGPQASPKTQMAVTCEITSRLSAVPMLPRTRLLDHGARYLQDYFSAWVQQEGGYEAAFDEEEVE